MSDELRDKVHRWFLEQGFPHEMRVAEVFQEAGFGTLLGDFYSDPVEGKRRELDVVATIRRQDETHRFEIVLRFLIQCKVSKDKPWIFFHSTNEYRTQLDLRLASINGAPQLFGA